MEISALERQARLASRFFGAAGTGFLLYAAFEYWRAGELDVASLGVGLIGWLGAVLCVDQAKRIRNATDE